jgi:hypothetical protein
MAAARRRNKAGLDHALYAPLGRLISGMIVR